MKPFDEEAAKEIMAIVQKEYKQYQKLVFKEWDTVHFVDIRKILYLEAREKYTYAYTSSEEFSSKHSLSEYESVLWKMGFFSDGSYLFCIGKSFVSYRYVIDDEIIMVQKEDAILP